MEDRAFGAWLPRDSLVVTAVLPELFSGVWGQDPWKIELQHNLSDLIHPRAHVYTCVCPVLQLSSSIHFSHYFLWTVVDPAASMSSWSCRDLPHKTVHEAICNRMPETTAALQKWDSRFPSFQLGRQGFFELQAQRIVGVLGC